MYLHPTYAVTSEREPLGVLDAWMWAREERSADGVRCSQKESARWVEGYERVAEMAQDMPGTRLVYVADREADMVELMRRASELGTPANWLVRAKHDRCLPESEGTKLWTSATSAEPVGEITFVTGARENQKSRTVRQWAREVEIADGRRGKIKVHCVVAREVGAPAGVKPIEWRLLTNRIVATQDQAVELINWYRARWEIEIGLPYLYLGVGKPAAGRRSGQHRQEAATLFDRASRSHGPLGCQSGIRGAREITGDGTPGFNNAHEKANQNAKAKIAVE